MSELDIPGFVFVKEEPALLFCFAVSRFPLLICFFTVLIAFLEVFLPLLYPANVCVMNKQNHPGFYGIFHGFFPVLKSGIRF